MVRAVEDLILSVKAHNIEEAFSKMAISMFDIVINTEDIDLIQTKTVIMRSRDLKNLLYQLLKRLYDLANNELFVLSTVKSISIEQVGSEYLLNAVFIGDRMQTKYEVKDIIKQVTDRNLMITEDLQGTSAQINLVVERRKETENGEV